MTSVGQHLEPELVEKLDRLRSSTWRNVDGLGPGSHRSLLKGASTSFRQHRAYVRGDDPRRLDWRVLARTDRLFVKEFDHDTNLQCVIAVDISGSMAYGDASMQKSNYALRLATALAYVLLRGGESVGLALMRDTVGMWLRPAQGTAQLTKAVEVLDRSAAYGTGDLPAALDDLRRRLSRRSLVVILSDLFCTPAVLGRSISTFVQQRHEVVCVRLLHPDEMTFPFHNMTRLRNLESDRSQVVEPALDRSAYLQNFNRHGEAISRACAAGRASLVLSRTDRPMIGVIEQLLRRRSNLSP